MGERWSPWFRIANIAAYYLILPAGGAAIGAVLGALIAVNIAQIFWYRSGHTIIASGTRGIVFEWVHGALAILSIALALPERTYFPVQDYLPMNTYFAPTLLFLTLYPRPANGWRGWGRRWLKSWWSDFTLSLLGLALMSLGVLINGYPVSTLTPGLLLGNYFWLFISICVGYVCWFISQSFAQTESDLVRHAYQGLERWLHSELKTDVASIRSRMATIDLVHIRADLERLDRKIGDENISRFVGSEPIALRALFEDQALRWPRPLTLKSLPKRDVVVVAEIGRMASRILGELVSNAFKAGAYMVTISFEDKGGFMYLVVEDDGPGLTDEGWLRSVGSLGTLRFDLEQNGGRLSYSRAAGTTRLEARVPLDAAPTSASRLETGKRSDP